VKTARSKKFFESNADQPAGRSDTRDRCTVAVKGERVLLPTLCQNTENKGMPTTSQLRPSYYNYDVIGDMNVATYIDPMLAVLSNAI
jgi:hypothetical protein